MVAAPSPARSRRPARPVRGVARFACSRAFSRSSKLVRSVMGPVVSLPTPALRVRARVVSSSTRRWPSRSRPASTREIAYGSLARVSTGVNGGPSGDLYVQIHLKAHPVFQREQSDLHCEMPISFTTAALGGEIDIPTLDGAAKVRIPAETQSGKVFRLRGKGIKSVRSQAHGICCVTWLSKRRFI
jgi:hypothetical protein